MDALENRYQKKIGIRKYASQVKALIPLKMKRWLKGEYRKENEMDLKQQNVLFFLGLWEWVERPM